MTSTPLLPTPRQMIAHLDRFVRGQVRAKQDMAVAVYNHYLAQAYRDREGVDLGRHHILLIGPTGVGKTHMVRTLAEFLGVPVGFTSAAGLVEVGYKGNSVESVVRSLLDRAGGDPRKAEKGIVFIDEIDKIKQGDVGGGRDVSGEGVQNALLTLLDGRLSEGNEGSNHPAVDTGRLLFVCTGAFVGLNKIVESRLGLGRNRIGFIPREEERVADLHDEPLYTALCQVQTSDLVQFGMIPEFIGRFATIAVLHELSHADLKAIVTGQIEHSALERQRRLAMIHGIELEITDDALDALTAEARALGTGARGLARLIGRAVDSVDAEWPELADQGVCKVVINKACVLKGGAPELIKGKPAVQRMDEELRRECIAGLPPRPSAVINGSRATGGAALGISDTRDWSEEQVRDELERVKADHLEWKDTTGSARKWWEAFEAENTTRLRLVLRLAEELKVRNASITEFFLAYVYSNTDNIQANLHYLDYSRLKKEEERKRRAQE